MVDVVEQLKPILCQGVRPPGSCGMFSGVELIDREGSLIFTVQTIVFDEGGSITDVREQECFFGKIADYDDDARNLALAEALIVVVGEAVAALKVDDWQLVMPVDLVPRDLVTLGNCDTQAQFEKALRTKKRLGKYLV
ncbi:MAG: hypothetical protein Q8O67_24495 [Deltaproteobacteria bacterium]|nr:hypothetical protein [Deltaproteobacteria bacterium]